MFMCTCAISWEQHAFFHAAYTNTDGWNNLVPGVVRLKVIYQGVAVSNRNECRFEPILAQTLEHRGKPSGDTLLRDR